MVPYSAMSVNGRGMEWKIPLWNAIWQYNVADGTAALEAAVIAVERAVERAMEIAIDEHSKEEAA